MEPEAFDDPVLGRVTPGRGRYQWQYTVSVGGREARGTIEIEDDLPVLGEPLLGRHRRFVAWLRGGEAAVRDHLVGLLYPEWRGRGGGGGEEPAPPPPPGVGGGGGAAGVPASPGGGGGGCFNNRGPGRGPRHPGPGGGG